MASFLDKGQPTFSIYLVVLNRGNFQHIFVLPDFYQAFGRCLVTIFPDYGDPTSYAGNYRCRLAILVAKADKVERDIIHIIIVTTLSLATSNPAISMID